MLRPLASVALALLRPAAERPLIEDIALRERLQRLWQWRIFLSVTLGYGLFYTCRLALSVAKKPLLDAHVLTAPQLGTVGGALLIAYAAGKAVNGFLGDRVHLKRFFILGLALSALTNLGFGLSSAFPIFVLLWAANGWFQSVGATTSGISLGSWFPARELGTRYGVWSLSHNIGEALTFAVTASLVDAAGWRWGFLGPALLCLAGAALLTRTLADRPRSLGLPAPRPDHASPQEDAALSIGAVQRRVLRDPLVWTLALASAFMYVTRYALNNWGVLLLQEDKGMTLVDAGRSLALVPLAGALGSVVSGLVSDRLCGGRRGGLSLLCGALLCGALLAVLYLPARPGAERLLLQAALGAVGFATGAQLVFLGGLAAMERSSRRASGAALGVVGGVSNLGAALQDLLSGHLIRALPGGGYDFAEVKPVWLIAGVLSVVMTLPLWIAERRARRASA